MNYRLEQQLAAQSRAALAAAGDVRCDREDTGAAMFGGFADPAEVAPALTADEESEQRIGRAMVKAGYGWPSITPADCSGRSDVDILVGLGCPESLAKEILA